MTMRIIIDFLVLEEVGVLDPSSVLSVYPNQFIYTIEQCLYNTPIIYRENTK